MKLNEVIPLLLVILVSISTHAQAANGNKAQCTNVDLRPEMGPVRDQGDKGWCYANAAADLLSFKHRNELHGQQVSAAYTALTYLRSTYGSIGDGGYVSAAVYASEEFGICPRTLEDKVEHQGLSKLTLSQRLDALKAFKIDYDKLVKGDAEATKRWEARYSLYVKNKSIVAQLSRNDLFDILDHSTPRTFINEFAKNLCKGQVRVPYNKPEVVFDSKLMSNPVDVSVPGWLTGQANSSKVHIDPIAWNPLASHKDFVAKIDEQLSQNNIVAIDYFSKFLETDFIKHPHTARDGMHSSVVVGRRWNTNTNSCDYLIRNSWGSQCWSYQVRQNCEAGNIWVPEDVLRYNMYAYIYLK